MTASSAPDPAALLEELAALREAATPGEWANDVPRMVHASPVGRVKGGYVAGAEHEEDAALIVAAVNALPRLVGAVRAVLGLADEWEDSDWQRDRGAETAAELRAAVTGALAGEPQP